MSRCVPLGAAAPAPWLGQLVSSSPAAQRGGQRRRSPVLASGEQEPAGHGSTHLPAQRGAEPVVESQEAVSADHMHRHPHHPHLRLLLRLQVDLGQSPAASAHPLSTGQQRESAGQRWPCRVLVG